MSYVAWYVLVWWRYASYINFRDELLRRPCYNIPAATTPMEGATVGRSEGSIRVSQMLLLQLRSNLHLNNSHRCPYHLPFHSSPQFQQAKRMPTACTPYPSAFMGQNTPSTMSRYDSGVQPPEYAHIGTKSDSFAPQAPSCCNCGLMEKLEKSHKEYISTAISSF